MCHLVIRNTHRRRFCFLILAISLLVSCARTEYPYKLSGGYVLIRTSAHQTEVVPRGDVSPETPIIPPKVVEVGWCDSFIIAKQQHLRRKYPDNPDNTYLEPNPGKYSYWILDVKTPKVFGPFDEKGFTAERQRLGVPKDLKLRNADFLEK